MKSRIKVIKKICDIIYEALIFTLLGNFFQSVFFKKPISPLIGAAILVLFGFSTFWSKYAHNYFDLFFVQMLFNALVFAIPIDIFSKVMLYLLGFVQIIKSYYYVKRKRHDKRIESSPWVVVGFFLVCYAYGSYLHNQILVIESCVMIILLLILFFVRLYMQGLMDYIEVNKNNTNIPLNRVVSTNNMVLCFILLGFGLLMIIAKIIGIDEIAKLILELLRYVIILVGGAFVKVFNFIVNVLAIITKDSKFKNRVIQPPEMTEKYVKPAWVDIVDAGIKIVCAAILIYILFKFIRKLINVLMIKIKKINPEDIVEKADSVDFNEKEKKNIFGVIKEYMSSSSKVRRFYKFKIMRYKEKICLKSTMNCTEIENKLIEEEICDISEMNDIYKQVRYGGVLPSKEMVKRMDKLAKES